MNSYPLRSLLKAVACAGCIYLMGAGTAAVAQDPSPPLAAGTHAPAFKARSLGGSTVSLSSLRGHVVLVDFWATWCGPCKMAMPTLQHLYKQFGPSGFRVVGMSVDDASTVGDIRPVLKQLGVTYTITSSKDYNAKAESDYNVNGIPSQVLIDKKGVVRWSQSGYSEDEGTELAALIKKLQKQ